MRYIWILLISCLMIGGCRAVETNGIKEYKIIYRAMCYHKKEYHLDGTVCGLWFHNISSEFNISLIPQDNNWYASKLIKEFMDEDMKEQCGISEFYEESNIFRIVVKK